MQVQAREIERTPWMTILILVGAGVMSAIQVGKATVALTSVQDDLQLGLTIASWLLSAFAIVGALAGGPIGLAVDRIGAKLMLVSGLILQAVPSALGALADGAALLLAMRALEGLGFLCVVVAAPVLIVRIAATTDRERALALWATFMPLGITVSLLAAPILAATGWRGFWLVNAALLTAYALLTATGVPAMRAAGPARSITIDIRDALKAAGPWLLAMMFAIFNASYFAVFGFLPITLTDRLAVSSETASILTGLAVMASALGNLACGMLLSKGVRPWLILMVSFALLGAGAVGIFLSSVPAPLSYALSVGFAFVSGFIPVVVMDAVPRHAPRPDLVGATMGFVMQGNNVGMVIGPAATGFIAATFGWGAISLFVAGMAVVAGALALNFRARETSPAQKNAGARVPVTSRC
jgi:MFS transporter, DHA1 family, inner membrane transport protein